MITLNGKQVELDDEVTVQALLGRQGFNWPMIIVRVNGALVKKDAYASATVRPGDRVEVIHMMSGG